MQPPSGCVFRRAVRRRREPRGTTQRWSVALRAVSGSRRKPSAVSPCPPERKRSAPTPPVAALNLTANARSRPPPSSGLTGAFKITSHHTSCIRGSATRGDELLEACLQGRRHGKQREFRPRSTTRARAPAALRRATGAYRSCAAKRGRRRSRRSRTTGGRDGLRVVRSADHASKPGTDPEVVLGHLPAPGLGTDASGNLWQSRRRGGRETGPGARAHRTDAAGLAAAPRRARRPAGRRPRLRPRPSGPRPGTGAGTGGIPAARPPDRRPSGVLTSGLQYFSSSWRRTLEVSASGTGDSREPPPPPLPPWAIRSLSRSRRPVMPCC